MRGKSERVLLFACLAVILEVGCVALLVDLWQRLLVYYAVSTAVAALLFAIWRAVLRRSPTKKLRTVGTFLALNALLVLAVTIVGTIVTILGRT